MADFYAQALAVVAKSLSPRAPGQTEALKFHQDRALRIVRQIESLAATLSDVPPTLRLDLACIAALYVNVPLGASSGSKPMVKNASGRTSPTEESAADIPELASEQLDKILPVADLELLLQILRDYTRRDVASIEAKLLSDAVALEDVGLIGFWNQTRTFHKLGRSLEQYFKAFRTQVDYGYWETRLRDGFHLPAARARAEQRLAAFRDIIAHLETQQNGTE